MEKYFVRQQGETDCGVACLLSALRYFGSDATLEKLREISGTSLQGTSLLGLCQAAEQLGLQALPFEVDDLAEFKQQKPFPCILHVVIDEQLEHYVVCYGHTESHYTIADPAKGIEQWTEQELLQKWKSRAMLQLKETEQLVKVSQNNHKKWAWFSQLIKEDIPLLSIAAVLGVVLATLSLATAIFSQKLIDDYLPHHKTDKLWVGLGLLGLILLFKTGLGYVRTIFLLRQSRDFNIRIANRFYESLLYLPKSFFDSRKTGELVARMNDTRRIQNVIGYLVGNVVIDVLIVLISMGFIFYYSVPIGLIALFSIPLFGYLVYRFNHRIIKQQQEVMNAYARTESNYIDTIGGIATIKASNKENFFINITQYTYQHFQQSIYNLGRLGNQYGTSGEFINTVLVVLIFGWGAWMVLEQTLKLGEMMAVISIASGLVVSIARLATTNIQIQEARVAFDRMFEFATLPSENNANKNTKIDGINSLIIKNISFRFVGRKQLLTDVSLHITKGKITALLGEIGSGKSILLQILQQFLSPENGEIWINNTSTLSEIAPKEWRKQIGVVHQDVKIFNGTLLDNITLGNIIEEGDAAIAFCKELGFDTYFESLPQSYITIVGEEGINLSGGQKQLVALARALYRKPTLLLLDEATAAMDSKTEDFVMALLQNLKPKMGILFVTHRKSIAQQADAVYNLEDGISKVFSMSIA